MSLRNPAAFPLDQNESREVNLTPMLDVVFILLIFFVVTATFLREFGVSVDAPEAPFIDQKQVEPIVVIVEPAGTFAVNGRRVGAENLLPYVQGLAGEHPNVSYSVLMAPGAKTGDIVKSIDVGRQIGIQVVPIANQ